MTTEYAVGDVVRVYDPTIAIHNLETITIEHKEYIGSRKVPMYQGGTDNGKYYSFTSDSIITRKETCKKCKDLPEGEVVKGHDHRTF